MHNLQSYLEVLSELETNFLIPNEELKLYKNMEKENNNDDRKKSISLSLDTQISRKKGKTTFNKKNVISIHESCLPANTKKFSISSEVKSR